MSNDTKRDRAVKVAADLFMRYGFARTTMGDIASAAEMSRPALYLLFPGKEEVFEAAVLHLNQLRLEEIRGSLARSTGLVDQLSTALDLWLVRVYELKLTVPDARDMDDLSFPVVRKVYDDLQAMVAELIAEAAPDNALASPKELARNLVFATRGLGATATGVDDMAAMTRLQVDLLCSALKPARTIA